jgi:two-component system response regulator AtoC
MDSLVSEQLGDPLCDGLILPVRPEDVTLAIRRGLLRRDALNTVSSALTVKSDSRSGLIGESAALREGLSRAGQVARSPNTSVLIEGESGTGKELLARLIHAETPGRRHRPFVDLNCAAIPADLLEAELFGFERGAFTNAGRDKVGLMELAHGGTLFLDEIGELNVSLQAKLLRVLETGSFRRLGGVVERRSDCRVLASTNRNLLDAVQQGLFRLDLYHRLAVLTIHTPPLRDRREDIPLLAEHFLRHFSAQLKKVIHGFSPTAEALLLGYPYPGNIRELRNIIERAVIVCSGALLTPKDLGLELALMADTVPTPAPLAPSSKPIAPLAPSLTLADAERQQIEQVLLHARGNRALAARVLHISLPTLYKKMRKYNLETVGLVNGSFSQG